MDAQGNIYPVSDLSKDQHDLAVQNEDIARLDGFLRGRAEADRVRHEKFESKHGTRVWDPATQGTYRKPRPQENSMGIEGIEEVAGHGDDQPEPAEPANPGTPGPSGEPAPGAPSETPPDPDDARSGEPGYDEPSGDPV